MYGTVIISREKIPQNQQTDMNFKMYFSLYWETNIISIVVMEFEFEFEDDLDALRDIENGEKAALFHKF